MFTFVHCLGVLFTKTRELPLLFIKNQLRPPATTENISLSFLSIRFKNCSFFKNSPFGRFQHHLVKFKFNSIYFLIQEVNIVIIINKLYKLIIYLSISIIQLKTRFYSCKNTLISVKFSFFGANAVSQIWSYVNLIPLQKIKNFTFHI